MITTHVDAENHILEVTIADKITREDLSTALSKIEGPMREWESIRVLKRVDSFTGMEWQALIDDFKFAYVNFKNYKKITKVALVTDKEWAEKAANFFRPIIPGEVQVFEQEDIEKARSWLI